jgi:hypothetical protein
MKKMQSQRPDRNTQFNANKNRPEIRDDMDSRKNEEQDYKGDDVTHNTKDHKNKHPEKRK